MPLRRATERGQRGAARERDLAHLANKSFDVQGQSRMQAPAPLQSVLTAALPAAASWPGAILYVSDAVAGKQFQGSDGSAWGALWGPVQTADIANDAVTYAKIQNVSATDKVLGRATAGAGDVEEIACTAAGRALLDDASAAAQATTLGLGTGDSPQFTAVNIGHATDTTLTRVSAGVVAVEGSTIPSGYAIGTWTPADGSGAGLSLTVTSAQYVKIGQFVLVQADITYPVTASGLEAVISGLPFTCQSVNGYGGGITYTDATQTMYPLVISGGTTVKFGLFTGALVANVALSTFIVRFVCMYRATT